MTRIALALSVAAVAGCTSEETGANVVGTRFRRYHQHSGVYDRRRDTEATAWLPDQRGFEPLHARATAVGAFEISGIPEGATYWLHLNDASNDVYYVTDQRVVELHDETALRYRPTPAILSSPTPISLELTGMTPYAEAAADILDYIEINSYEIGYQGFGLQTGMHAGDSAITRQLDWARLANTDLLLGIALPDSDLGDEVDITHHRTEWYWTRPLQTVSTTYLADLLRTNLTLRDGEPATLAARFPPLVRDHEVSVAFDPSFDAATASATTLHDSRWVRISAHPIWGEAVHQLTLFSLTVDLREDPTPVPPLVDYGYADPLPSTWKRTLTISDDQSRAYRYPGPLGGPFPDLVLAQTTTVVTELGEVIATDTALPRPSNISLGGQDFLAGGKLPFDGRSSIPLSWAPVPLATSYQLEIWRLEPIGTVRVASIYSDGTSLLLPAMLFHDNDVLCLVLSAEQYPRETPGSLVPNGLPRRTTKVASGRFHLTAHCGDGVVQSGEECDDGRETAACNTDCTLAQCGDGIRNAAFGEECDDVFATSGCTATCVRLP